MEVTLTGRTLISLIYRPNSTTDCIPATALSMSRSIRSGLQRAKVTLNAHKITYDISKIATESAELQFLATCRLLLVTVVSAVVDSVD